MFIDNPPVLGWLRDGDDETNDQKPNLRFWPVPPLAVMYRVEYDALVVVRVLDTRRLRERP